MGLFSGIGSFFGPIGSILGGVGDDIIGRDDAAQANNTAYAQQRQLRQTAYQDTTQDLKAAGLNPMLAYSNGATAAAGGPPVLNKGLTSAQQNSAKASIENIEADTQLKQAQAAKLSGVDTENTLTSTGKMAEEKANINQQTSNLRQQISTLLSQQKLYDNQATESSARAALNAAQQALANIQARLANGTINMQEAQTALYQAQTKFQTLQTKLREYDEPQAVNEASYQLSTMGENEPYARGLSTYGDAVWNSVGGWKRIFGKSITTSTTKKIPGGKETRTEKQ